MVEQRTVTRKTKKQLQSEQTRQLIIQSAAEQFAHKGYYGTSIADLAQAVGLTKGALYHHFENKEALFFAVVKWARAVWRDGVVRNVLKAEDALTRLAVLLDNHARLTADNKVLCHVLDRLATEVEGINPDFSTALQELMGELTLFVQRIVEKGQAAGQVRSDLDARQIALNVVGILRSGYSSILNSLSADNAARATTLRQMLLDGLRP